MRRPPLTPTSPRLPLVGSFMFRAFRWDVRPPFLLAVDECIPKRGVGENFRRAGLTIDTAFGVFLAKRSASRRHVEFAALLFLQPPLARSFGESAPHLLLKAVEALFCPAPFAPVHCVSLPVSPAPSLACSFSYEKLLPVHKGRVSTPYDETKLEQLHEGLAVEFAGAKLAQETTVEVGPVALMLFKAVSRVAARERQHPFVSPYFCDN